MKATTDTKAEIRMRLYSLAAVYPSSSDPLDPGDLAVPEVHVRASTWKGKGISGASLSANWVRDDLLRRSILAITSKPAADVKQPWHYGQGGFDWNGGSPSGEIDISEFENGVFREADVATIHVERFAVITDRMPVSPFTVTATGSSWIEGELESDRLRGYEPNG